MPEVTQEQRREKYNMLNSVNKDFIAIATVYAKTIISEFFLPDDKKSIKLTAVGGVAGGKKYLWRDILFKLVDGTQGPYERDHEAASKAMGHEMKSVNQYYRCTMVDIHVALQALIDYKGFRMLAQAYLPIEGKKTLIIGSADGMVSVSNSLGALSAAQAELVRSGENSLKYAAKELNIAEHMVGEVKMYSACDVEGHIGSDGRFYIVDLARTFPPEAPSKAAHLVRCADFHIGQVVVVAIPVDEAAPGVESDILAAGGVVSDPAPVPSRSSSVDSLALSTNSTSSAGISTSAGRKKSRLHKAPSNPSLNPGCTSGKKQRFRKYRGFVWRVYPGGLYDVFCPSAPPSASHASPKKPTSAVGSKSASNTNSNSGGAGAKLEIVERLRRCAEGLEPLSHAELARAFEEFSKGVHNGGGGHKKS